MRTFQPILTTSVQAAVDIEKYRFIGFDGNYCGADQKALGVSEVEATQGEQCSVVCEGIALVVAGGAIPQGAAVASDANAQAVEATTGAINGYALDAAAGAGEVIRVKLV